MKSSILLEYKHLRLPLALLMILLALQTKIPISSEASDYETAVGPRQQAPDWESIALDYVSSNYGLPREGLMVLGSALRQFPLEGVVLRDVKIYDQTGRLDYEVSIDQTGRVVPDRSAVADREGLRYFELYGRLSPKAIQLVSAASSSQLIDVGIWVDGAQNFTYPSRDLPREERLSIIQSFMEELTKPVVDYLAKSGYRVKYVSMLAPLVYATIPATQMNLLAREPTLISQLRIGFIDTEEKNMTLLMDSAKLTLLQNVVMDNYGWTGAQGAYCGSGPVRVGVVEDDGVNDRNRYLSVGSPFYYKPATKNIGDHATHVAGIIAANQTAYLHSAPYGGSPLGAVVGGDFRGMAPGARILSLNIGSGSSESDNVAAMEWAVVTGCTDILNHSYTLGWTFSAYTAFIDSLVVYGMSQVMSAANGGLIGNPGLSSNAITVGSFDDRNTPEWGDDQFSWWASYDDSQIKYPGTTTDYNKPDVVAVGEHVFSTGAYTGYDMSYAGYADAFSRISGTANTFGTSFSAPQVAGLLATLIHHGVLSLWPEQLKAITMASAVHRFSDVPLDRQGAGGIVGQYAHDIVTNGWTDHWYQSKIYNLDWDFKTYDIPLMRGETFQAALVWDRHTAGTYPGISSSLKADLDLRLYGPPEYGGGLWQQSATYSNSAEYFNFIAPVPGTYKLAVHVWRWDNDNLGEYIGVAWWHGLGLNDLLGFTALPTGSILMVVGDILTNPHGTKPPGVAYQRGRDTTPLGILAGMIGLDPGYGEQRRQRFAFDTDFTLVDANGRPLSPSPPLIIAIGGPGVNSVTHYYETTSNLLDRAPISFSDTPDLYCWYDRNGNPVGCVAKSDIAIPPGTSDVFVIQILRDGTASGRLVVLMYGVHYTGTWAAAVYFKHFIYPNISTWHGAYFIVHWEDGAPGFPCYSCNYIPDAGDTFTVTGAGNPP